MNKLCVQASLATMLAIFTAPGSVWAADLGKGGMKDYPVAASEPADRASDHSGFYIKGDLGIATGNRSGSVSVTREKGEYDEIKPTDEELKANPDALSSFPQIAKIIDQIGSSGSEDVDMTVFGGEISYLYRPNGSRFGFEVGLGGTFYTDNESKGGFIGTPTITGGTFTELPCGSHCVGDPANFGRDSADQAAAFKFERDLDIDLVGRVHFFVLDNLAVNVGAGPSWAFASFSGGTESLSSNPDHRAYDGKFSGDDNSLGYVLTAGVTFWATDRLTIGAAYEYKNHSWDFDVNKTTADAVADGETYRNLKGHGEVEDELHLFKVRAGLKLN